MVSGIHCAALKCAVFRDHAPSTREDGTSLRSLSMNVPSRSTCENGIGRHGKLAPVGSVDTCGTHTRPRNNVSKCTHENEGTQEMPRSGDHAR